MTARVLVLVATSIVLGVVGVLFLLFAISVVSKSLAKGDISGAFLTGKGVVNLLLFIAGIFLLKWSTEAARKARRPLA